MAAAVQSLGALVSQHPYAKAAALAAAMLVAVVPLACGSSTYFRVRATQVAALILLGALQAEFWSCME